jgi:hypothetical protein
MYVIAGADKTHDLWAEMRTIDLEFSGTPGSIMIAGEPAPLTSVSFDLTSKLDYKINVMCRDYSSWSDCYTRASYCLLNGFGPGGLMFPDQDFTPLYIDHDSVEVSHWCMSGWASADYYKEVHERPGRFFSISADDYDLSFLDVDNFTIEILRNQFLIMSDCDPNDDVNCIILGYKWEGDLTISYEYDAVPIPGAVWLLGSGLLGLIGIRLKKG